MPAFIPAIPMKFILTLPLTLTLLTYASAQTKSNASIAKQISQLGSSRSIELSYDEGSNVSKLRGVSENFPHMGRVGVKAMNFAIGFMYPGREIAAAPAKMMFSFWVLTRNPRFAAGHDLIVLGGKELGPGRYAAKPREDMEYLNYEISREDLAMIAEQPQATFKLGQFELSFTRSQQKLIADVLKASDPAR